MVTPNHTVFSTLHRHIRFESLFSPCSFSFDRIRLDKIWAIAPWNSPGVPANRFKLKGRIVYANNCLKKTAKIELWKTFFYLRSIVNQQHDPWCCHHSHKRLVPVKVFVHFGSVNWECKIVHLFGKVILCLPYALHKCTIHDFTSVTAVVDKPLNNICWS